MTCEICRMQRAHIGAHWAWHNYCRAELNPVALLLILDGMPQTNEVQRLRGYVVAATGMDVDGARAAARAELVM